MNITIIYKLQKLQGLHKRYKSPSIACHGLGLEKMNLS